MEQIHDVKNWQMLFWGIIAASTLVKAYYYLQVKEDKSLIEFVMSWFSWASPIVVKNIGADRTRRKFMEVNNRCMVALWLSLFMQLILLFY